MMNYEKESEVIDALSDYVIRVAKNEVAVNEGEVNTLPEIAKVLLADDGLDRHYEKEKDRAFSLGLSLGLSIGTLIVSVIALLMQLLK